MANTPGKNPYSLSIRIFSDGFSLYIHDENSALLSVKHLRNREPASEPGLRELMNQSELKTSFNKTRVIIETGLYTLIPDHFGAESRALLALQHPFLSDEYPAITNHIDGQGSNVVFAAEPVLFGGLQSAFPGIVPQLHLNTFLRHPSESSRVILWNRNKEADLMLFEQGKCMLMNSFNISSVDDIIYYSLNLYREFGLSRNEFALWAYCPETSEKSMAGTSDLSAGLKSFFGNISIIQQTKHYEDYQW